VFTPRVSAADVRPTSLPDTYQRGGIYTIPCPATLGNEVAGTVAKLGPGVDPKQAGFDVGDRVAVRSRAFAGRYLIETA
jgi:NADPH:quinone reductase-like Zn-dependent oxidoreductase